MVIILSEANILKQLKKVKIAGSDTSNLHTAGNFTDTTVCSSWIACECHAVDLGYITGLPVHSILLSCCISE